MILTVKANFSFASAGSGDYIDEKKTVEHLGRGGEENDAKEKKHKGQKHHEKKHKDNADNKDIKNLPTTAFLRKVKVFVSRQLSEHPAMPRPARLT